jgi:hypothetical protein
MVRPGDVVELNRLVSVQFSSPIMVRVTRVYDWVTTWDGWCWLSVYVLDERGDAVERRDVYVRLDALVPLRGTNAVKSQPPAGRPVNAGRHISAWPPVAHP